MSMRVESRFDCSIICWFVKGVIGYIGSHRLWSGTDEDRDELANDRIIR
jgi:hypothetical protein